MNRRSRSVRRVGAVLLVLSVIAGWAQTSNAQESGALGTPEWFFQTLPVEAPAAGNTPEASTYAQLLPALGRDELWLSRSQRWMDLCEPLTRSAESIPDYVAERARSTRIVIVNESHDIPWHRMFTESLLRALWDQGFRYLAAEAFGDGIGNYPDEDFGRIDAGFYATESTFGSLIRTAKQLGYNLIHYESIPDETDLSVAEQIALREEGQANNLMARVFALDPSARVVIHVGYSHAAEVPIPSSPGITMPWMAARLKEKSGIDPLTIDQTYCRSSGDDLQLVKPSGRMPLGAFDFAIAYPEVSTIQARATWRLSGGMRLVNPPNGAIPVSGRAILEARPVDEPNVAIPVDRLLLLAGESIPLVLPSGEFRLSVTTEGSAEIKEFQLVVE